MKKLIPTISKMAMGGEPPRKPIYVSSKNDPRLKAYQDSLILHSNPTNYKTAIGVDAFIELNKINKKYPKPIYDDKTGKIEYKKPIQPVEYRPTVKPKSKVIPKVTPVINNKKIQMKTTKIDTTPVVQPTIKTPPTPLTKKQYYEVPDANGKNVLLTPEQFSRMSSGNKNDLMSKSPIMNKPKYFYEMNSSGKRQLVPENKIREYMQTKNK
jgi:hypothetical protein